MGLSSVHLLNNDVVIVSVFGPLPLILESFPKQPYPLVKDSQICTSSPYLFWAADRNILLHLDIPTWMSPQITSSSVVPNRYKSSFLTTFKQICSSSCALLICPKPHYIVHVKSYSYQFLSIQWPSSVISFLMTLEYLPFPLHFQWMPLFDLLSHYGYASVLPHIYLFSTIFILPSPLLNSIPIL